MRAGGRKRLKSRPSEYVRLAAGGETVLVTDRDRVVAELVPPQAGRRPFLADGQARGAGGGAGGGGRCLAAARLAEAVREGWVTPPVFGAAGAPPRNPVMAFRDLLAELHDS